MNDLNLKTYHLPISKDVVVVHWRIIDKRIRKILMAPITEKQESDLDKGYTISVITHFKGYVLSKEDAIVYGNIDFSNDSNDLDFIRDLEWCIEDYFKGVCIPSRYNYEKHTALGNRNGILYYDTVRSDIILKYKHGCLNKPERVIVWKEVCKIK